MTPRVRVFSAFFLYAFALGGFYPRLAEVQRLLGVAEAGFGLALIGAATGTLISLTFAGPWLERLGHRRVFLLGLPALAACYVAAAFASTPAQLFLALVAAGLCMGGVEIVVNLEADRLEHASGRRLMNRAHAFWSLGFFVAGLVAAAAAQAGIGARAHLLAVAPLVAVAAWVMLAKFEPAPHRVAATAPPARWAAPTRAIWVLVALSVSALVLEGAAADWAAIYMRDTFAAPPFAISFAVAIGALTQAATRYVADGFVERHSPRRVARWLLGVLAAGTVIVTAALHPLVSLLGFALMGVGTSAMFPLAMSAAAQRTDRPAAINVAALAQTSFVAFLLGPPLLGVVAQAWGIRWSFGIGLPLLLASWVATRALASSRPADAPSGR